MLGLVGHIKHILSFMYISSSPVDTREEKAIHRCLRKYITHGFRLEPSVSSPWRINLVSTFNLIQSYVFWLSCLYLPSAENRLVPPDLVICLLKNSVTVPRVPQENSSI